MPIQKFGEPYRRKDSPYWWIWYYDTLGKRRHESTQTQDRALAMKILRSRIAEYSQLKSGVKETSDMPYAAFGEDYLKYVKARYTAETFKSYQTHVRVFGEYLLKMGLSKLSDIDYGLIQRFITERRNGGNKANTCNSYLKNLHAQFQYAVIQKLMPQNIMPNKYEKVPVTDSKEPKALTEIEYKSIMSRIKTDFPYYYPIFYVYFHTGLRFTELITQEWKDIYLDDKYFRVTRPKGKKKNVGSDTVDLSDSVIKIFKAFKGKHKTLVFVDENNEPFSIRTRKLIRRIQKIAKELGIEGVNLHTTRHTFGSHCIDAGATLEETQRALRHREIRTTQSYVHRVNPAHSRLTGILEKKLRI